MLPAKREFRKLALFAFGSIKYAFRRLSTDPGLLDDWVEAVTPKDSLEFFQRHDPIHPIQEILGEDTYYLGYVSPNVDASSPDALAEKLRREAIIQIGIKNYQAYLASDHLDVYVATSMREKHEYYLVNKWVKSIFGHDLLTPLKLRWFDPTQAYCLNRVDKGLFEGLMLKRAKCTIYFVQETDTFGKDSELASTLAQGKPVIAFIPTVDDEYFDELLDTLSHLDSGKSIGHVILNQLRIFNPAGAWNDIEIQSWLADVNTMDVDKAKNRLRRSMVEHYDKRTNLLQDLHPLGIQVNIRTGVANGVLVVRNIESCAELVYKIMTQEMEFRLEEKVDNARKYVYLKEVISGSIYRVVTGDSMLTNSFWSYYLDE